MSLQRLISFFLAGFLFSIYAPAQQPVPRDSQAVALVQQVVAAMRGVVPSDSVATGTIELVAGSKAETGTIRILTRGLDQTAEHIETGEGRRRFLYSRGRAFEGQSQKPVQLELAVTRTHLING